jgi:hypothetical protein
MTIVAVISALLIAVFYVHMQLVIKNYIGQDRETCWANACGWA